MFETAYSKTFDVSSFIFNYNSQHSFEVKDEIENQTLNCKIAGDYQIQTLRSVGHLRPGGPLSVGINDQQKKASLAIYTHPKWTSAT